MAGAACGRFSLGTLASCCPVVICSRSGRGNPASHARHSPSRSRTNACWIGLRLSSNRVGLAVLRRQPAMPPAPVFQRQQGLRHWCLLASLGYLGLSQPQLLPRRTHVGAKLGNEAGRIHGRWGGRYLVPSRGTFHNHDKVRRLYFLQRHLHRGNHSLLCVNSPAARPSPSLAACRSMPRSDWRGLPARSSSVMGLPPKF